MMRPVLLLLVTLAIAPLFMTVAAQAPLLAPTLARPITAVQTPAADGFLRRWLVLEPIRTTGQLVEPAVRALVQTEHFPEQLTALPRDGETVTVGSDALTWHAVESTGYNVNLYHFAAARQRPTSNAMFWVVTVVHAPHAIAGVRLAIGSNAASVWWLNGREVIGIYNDRQSVIDDGVSNRLTLAAGPNVIRAAVVNGGGATDFCARFLDEEGNPVAGLTIELPGNDQ